MVTKTITYTDYLGNKRTEEFCFHINKAELTEMNAHAVGGLKRAFEKMLSLRDGASIFDTFKELIYKGYGEISPDGKHFYKKDANGRPLADAFLQTEAYDVLLNELLDDDKAAISFMKGIFPTDIGNNMDKPEVKKEVESLTNKYLG